MALLFMESFDHLATADLSKKWNSVAGSPSVTSGGRHSSNCLATNTTAGVSKTVSNLSSVVVGFAFQTSALGNNGFVFFDDLGNNQVNLTLLSTGAIQAKRDTTALGTSAAVITISTWHYVECKVTIHDTTGSVEVYVNGASVLTLTNVDTKSTSNAYLTTVKLQGVTAGGSWFDDVYICDTTGSAPTNTFLGDCRVDALLPNADGTYTSWTPSTGTDHYALVDETTPNTSDYVSSSTTGHQDSYQMQDLSAITGTIYGAQALAAALKDDAGARSLKVGVRSSSSNSLGSAQALATGQVYYAKIQETDPATATAWTESGVNAAQVMVENV